MASGDITDKIGAKWDIGKDEQISHFTLEMVMADATSTKEEEFAINLLLTDLYLEAPDLDPSASTIKLELLTARDNVIYSTGDLDASDNAGDAMKHPIHLQRALCGVTTAKLTADADISENKTFMLEFFGM